ncbi:pilin [Nocardiopsis sp. FIRDI 009]|uniref:pilin n=1 Tax=Nocardiopsis sp. FIRDI 009 TaxID=714197 RepID=UPI000348D1BF|nr:pilin [Nocardiopsis sp. FIRDI 009]
MPGTALTLVLGLAEPALADDAWLFAYQLNDVILRLTRLCQTVAGSVATLFIIVAGLRWMLAGGDPNEIDKAKRGFAGAAVGYVVVFAGEVLLFALDYLSKYESP